MSASFIKLNPNWQSLDNREFTHGELISYSTRGWEVFALAVIIYSYSYLVEEFLFFFFLLFSSDKRKATCRSIGKKFTRETLVYIALVDP